ncbi:hypothetical protein A8F94_18635 [Bacillus sp. FJAT-27225]|uniref:hypothetical protein n=1 Tax=Bacillus sp. FJAT-27225 TaxID=1743144 RepID=UPI00080C2C41|nr:hypothetical protein [Bacillus sp. FJAT-27225]OCA83143.1 hypothetical protein A8F94_18635 [Bacillus sp. FJAT-27225]
MSSKIAFNANAVNSSIGDLNHSLAKLNSVQASIATLRGSIDPRILYRGGIGSRLAGVSRELNGVEDRVNRLKTFTSSSVEKYSSAEAQIKRQAHELMSENNLLKQALDSRTASDLYEFYNNTVGRLQDLLHGLQYSAGAGIMHLLGFKYAEIGGIFRQFDLADEAKFGKYKLPFGKYIKGVENSKAHFLSKLMVDPIGALKYKDKALSEFLYKRFANFFPSDIVNLSNNVAVLKEAIKRDGTSFKNGLSVVKDHAGKIVGSGLKVVKSNAILAGVITAGTEAVGASIKITENYSMYGGDVEKLKVENAKVVGEAAWKTVVVSGISVGGAVIGGTIGSLGGPVGTVIGATVGGMVGSWAGDIIAGKTSGWAQDVAVHFKDGIHSMTEGVRTEMAKVTNGFNNVKNFAEGLLSDSKKILGSLSFGN